MLARSDIHRSLSNMTINLHKAMERRRQAAYDYELAEREFQAQYDFSGKVGTLPVEAEITIPFSIMFMGDAGRLRDSALDRPHARLTAEMLYAPAGALPYHYVKRWQMDPDFNFIGAVVVVGMHCPVIAIEGLALTDRQFSGKLHASFQGYGLLIDDENSLGLSASDALPADMEMGIG